MIEIKSPGLVDFESDSVRVFLGGSIDMGVAEKWQDRLTKDLSKYSNSLVLLNPRRDDWDSSWVQDPTPGTKFYEQVSWELDTQEKADLRVYYFAPNSMSPITLLELGMFYRKRTIVCCPKEFYRHGNVKMLCDRYGVGIVETYDELLEVLHRYFLLFYSKTDLL